MLSSELKSKERERVLVQYQQAAILQLTVSYKYRRVQNLSLMVAQFEIMALNIEVNFFRRANNTENKQSTTNRIKI